MFVEQTAPIVLQLDGFVVVLFNGSSVLRLFRRLLPPALRRLLFDRRPFLLLWGLARALALFHPSQHIVQPLLRHLLVVLEVHDLFLTRTHSANSRHELGDVSEADFGKGAESHFVLGDLLVVVPRLHQVYIPIPCPILEIEVDRFVRLRVTTIQQNHVSSDELELLLRSPFFTSVAQIQHTDRGEQLGSIGVVHRTGVLHFIQQYEMYGLLHILRIDGVNESQLLDGTVYVDQIR